MILWLLLSLKDQRVGSENAGLQSATLRLHGLYPETQKHQQLTPLSAERKKTLGYLGPSDLR